MISCIHFRHVSAGFEMTELDFLILHMLVLKNLKVKTHITKAIGLMKINTIVRKQLAIEKEEQEGQVGDPNVKQEQEMAQASTPKGKGGKGKRKISKKTKESEKAPEEQLPDVIIRGRDIATQTTENIEDDIIEGEEEFQRNSIDGLRRRFVVDEIKE